MPDAAWKAFERKVARILGGERTGSRGLGLPDVLHSPFGIAPECKCYRGATATFFGAPTSKLRKAIAQAKVNQANVHAPHWAVFIKDRDIHGPEGEYVLLPMSVFNPTKE